MVRTYKVLCCLRVPKRERKVAPSPGDNGIFTVEGDRNSTITLDIACAPQQQVSEGARGPVPATAVAMQARPGLLWRLLLDLPILLLVGAVCVLLEVGALPSRRGGFVCRDPALSFPYTGDTFSIALVGAITVILPFLIILSVEVILYEKDEYSMKQSKLWTSVKTTAFVYRDYIYGAVVNLTILEVIKCVVGSPRPTFFDLCQPDKAKTCNGSEFISEYTCTSTRFSRYLQIDSSRSFPSAHASLSLYCGLFIAWYLQRRAFSWHNRSALVVPLLQTLCLTYAALGALTRITDHRHHWWDVLAGAVMGLLTLLYTVLVLCRNFSPDDVGAGSSSDVSSNDGVVHPSVQQLLPSGRHVHTHVAA